MARARCARRFPFRRMEPPRVADVLAQHGQQRGGMSDFRLGNGRAPQGASGRKDVIKLAASLVSMTIVVAALYFGQSIIIPIAVALLISFALNPLVTWMARRGLPRAISTSLAMVAVMVLVVGFGVLLTAQVRSLAIDLPNYQSTILAKLTALKETVNAPGIFDRAFETFDRVQREVAAPEPGRGTAAAPQHVTVVPAPTSPFEQAFTWLGRSLEPLATLGIVFIFVFLTLLDRGDLRDRLVRLMGDDLHRSTDSMEEAGQRISKYLLMQLVVNVSYGVPMALGLWWIGVPGALLWGTVAAVLRFIPYLGPMISAVFPLSLAFAVDDGWNMLIMVAALIVFLELVSNNVVEPLLYGTSTGLSTLSLIASAMFWTAIWGPIGLILSTPITVCLLVIGRNVPHLRFLDIILGSTPVLDPPMRLYQRLIANDPEEAVDLAKTDVAASTVADFYNDIGIPALRLASRDYLTTATAEHRRRLSKGLDLLLEELREEHPPVAGAASNEVVCIGGKWQIDNVSAEMLAHALGLKGIPATTRAISTVNSRNIGELNITGTEVLCICYFSEDPAIAARHFARRLRLRWPQARIVFALWNAPADLCDATGLERLSADAVVTSIDEAVLRLQRLAAPEEALIAQQAALPENEAERVSAIEASGILDQQNREKLDAIARRAANVFDADFAVISTITAEMEYFVGQSGKIPGAIIDDSGRLLPMPRTEAICNHVIAHDETLVVPDIHRDPRFSENPTIRRWGSRFYAGAAIRGADGEVFGALCLLHSEPRDLTTDEIEVLEEMAGEVLTTIEADE